MAGYTTRCLRCTRGFSTSYVPRHGWIVKLSDVDACLDDAVVHYLNPEEHTAQLATFFCQLEQHNMKYSRRNHRLVPQLGTCITSKDQSPTLHEVSAFPNMTTPKDVLQSHSLLGGLSYSLPISAEPSPNTRACHYSPRESSGD